MTSQKDWTLDIYSRIRAAQMTCKEFAAECGFSQSYLTRILRRKKVSITSMKTIISTMDRIETEKRNGTR